MEPSRKVQDKIIVDRDWAHAGISSIAGRHLLSEFGSYIDELMSGKVVTITDARTDARVEQSTLAKLNILAQINVPVVEHGKTVAIFFAHSTVPREWATEEVEFIRDVAERTRLARPASQRPNSK